MAQLAVGPNFGGLSVLDVFAMMGAGVPPNVALFNKDKLGVKFPVLLKFGSSVGEVAQDLLVTLALSVARKGKKVLFVAERPIIRLPVEGPKCLPPPPELLNNIDFWYCKTLRSLWKVFGQLHDLNDLPDVVIMQDLEGMLQDSDRFSVDLARCCGMIAQTFEYARQEKEIPFFVSCPRTPVRDAHQSPEDRHRFVEIPFNDYFPSVWKLKAVVVSPVLSASLSSAKAGSVPYDEHDNVGAVSLKTDRSLEVLLKVDRTEGLEPLTLRLPSRVASR